MLERIAATALADLWAVLFFGIIDLSVIAAPGDFAPVVALRGQLGVLFTFLRGRRALAVT